MGLAFHVQNDNEYDAIYFRPFNFLNEQRKNHSVQYISMPDYDWSQLRQNYPEKYKNDISNPPNPNDWFKVKVILDNIKAEVHVKR